MPDLFDAIVVGGGILGTALTWALAKRSLRVALLEARGLASGATGTGFGWVNATYKCDNRPYFDLNAQGVMHYDRLAQETGAESIGIYAGGSLFWADANDAAGRERLKQRAQRLQAWNYPALLLTPGELAVLDPQIARLSADETDNSVLFAPADKWVDTARLCRYFVAQAQTYKAEVMPHCAVAGFTRDAANHVSTVETSNGRMATGLVVLAAGRQTPQLVAQLTGDPNSPAQVPIRQEPGLLVQTPPLPPAARCHRVLYPSDEGGLHLRPTPEGGLLIGAEDVDASLNSDTPHAQSLLAFAQSGSSTLPLSLWHPLVERTARFLPGLRLNDIYPYSAPRICIRPVPTDGFPIVGALPEVPGAYVAVTHSGVTLGPLLAELLAGEIVTQALAAALAPYRPTRFSGA